MADELQPRYSVVQKNDHFSFFDESGQSFVTLSITNTIPQAEAEEVPDSFTEMEWLEAILGQGGVYGYLYTLKAQNEEDEDAPAPLMGWISPDFQHVYPPCFDSTAFSIADGHPWRRSYHLLARLDSHVLYCHKAGDNTLTYLPYPVRDDMESTMLAIEHTDCALACYPDSTDSMEWVDNFSTGLAPMVVCHYPSTGSEDRLPDFSEGLYQGTVHVLGLNQNVIQFPITPPLAQNCCRIAPDLKHMSMLQALKQLENSEGYDRVLSAGNGFYVVYRSGYCALLGTSYREDVTALSQLTPFAFTSIQPVPSTNDLFLATRLGKTGLLSANLFSIDPAVLSIPCDYDSVTAERQEESEDGPWFGPEYHFRVRKGNYEGVLDQHGRWLEHLHRRQEQEIEVG